jgi:hypothetical protein
VKRCHPRPRKNEKPVEGMAVIAAGAVDRMFGGDLRGWLRDRNRVALGGRRGARGR